MDANSEISRLISPSPQPAQEPWVKRFPAKLESDEPELISLASGLKYRVMSKAIDPVMKYQVGENRTRATVCPRFNGHSICGYARHGTSVIFLCLGYGKTLEAAERMAKRNRNKKLC